MDRSDGQARQVLFNTHIFIFAFLPATLALYYLAKSHAGSRLANFVLVATSLFFYGWWDYRYLFLFVASILFNFGLSRLIVRSGGRLRYNLAAFGVAANLALLAFFKYMDFAIGSLNQVLGTGWPLLGIILPIGISFYTFQQSAFLVDRYKGKRMEGGFLEYCLFVTFFPHLIAGPIVHHAEMMPQFARAKAFRRRDLPAGFALFTLGLAKKVLIADTIAGYSTPVFAAAAAGGELGTLDAWGGVLAYTFQIYFDFSGYSDMASGLALMFGIRLPINFFSPYKAQNVIDFWRRWHVTLSRLLRDYVYVPLGGNRKGENRRLVNIFLTMLLGGIWHGAGWTFVIWGALHGAMLCVNHIWVRVRPSGADAGGRIGRLTARAATFLLVVFAWTFFRADSVGSALHILGRMAGMVPAGERSASLPDWSIGIPLLAVLFLVCWFAPNSYELMRRYRPNMLIVDPRVVPSKNMAFWRATPAWGILIGIVFGICVVVMTGESEFLYFQF